MAKLTQRQEKFCREYVVSYNATQAAIKAGYSEKTARSMGSENLTKPDILARVRELQEDSLKALGLSEARIVTEIYSTYEGAKAAGNFKAALKALELLGKRAGIFNGSGASAQQDESELYKVLAGGK